MRKKKKQEIEINELSFWGKIFILSLVSALVFWVLSFFVPLLNIIAIIAICITGITIIINVAANLFKK